MFSTEYLRSLIDERERQVSEHVRVRNLIRPHRASDDPHHERNRRRGRERR